MKEPNESTSADFAASRWQAANFEALSPSERIMLYGEAAYLLARNPLHRAYTLQDLEQRVMHPISLNQFRMYRKPSGPVALLTWAFVSDALHDRFQREVFDLGPEDWSSGPHLWYIDFVAPFGDGGFVIEDMLTNVFPDLVGHAQRALIKSEKPFVLRSYYGVNVAWRQRRDVEGEREHG
ncbi:MAG: toxin-activating lysine-acyltransferase [Pseudomonadota bacterium]